MMAALMSLANAKLQPETKSRVQATLWSRLKHLYPDRPNPPSCQKRRARAQVKSGSSLTQQALEHGSYLPPSSHLWLSESNRAEYRYRRGYPPYTYVCLGRQATFSLPSVGVIRSVKHPRRWRFLQVQTSSVTGRVFEHNCKRESSKASQRVMLAWPLTVYPPDLYSFDSETWDGSRKETWSRQPCEAHVYALGQNLPFAAEEKSRNACLDPGDNLFRAILGKVQRCVRATRINTRRALYQLVWPGDWPGRLRLISADW